MDRRHFLLLLGLLPVTLRAQQRQPMTLDDLLDAGEQFLRDNFDEEFLSQFPPLDRAKVRGFLGQMQTDLQGEYVVDLAALRTSALVVLPLLEANQNTRPYASWLRPRMDYLEVADEFRLLIPPPKPVPQPKPQPGQPKAPAPKPPKPANPSPTTQRFLWERKTANRPAPKGAAAWVAKLKPVFAKQGVPPELVWVAEVESAFDPAARSPAGAVGLYQLMPATAKSLGLALTPKDQRLEPTRNATAAAAYLRQLYPKFKDWRLVLAAYNWGEGNVRRLLEKRRARTFDAIATHLPAETQMYVPKLEATLKRREKVTLARLRAPRV